MCVDVHRDRVDGHTAVLAALLERYPGAGIYALAGGKPAAPARKPQGKTA